MREKTTLVKKINQKILPFIQKHKKAMAVWLGVFIVLLTLIAITIQNTNQNKDNASAVENPSNSSTPVIGLFPRSVIPLNSSSSVVSSSSSISSSSSTSSSVSSLSSRTSSSLQVSSSLNSLSSSSSSIAISTSSVASVSRSSLNSNSSISSVTNSSSTRISSTTSSTISNQSSSIRSSIVVSSITNMSTQDGNRSVATSTQASTNISCTVYNPNVAKGEPVCLPENINTGNTVRTGGFEWLSIVFFLALAGSYYYYREKIAKNKHKLATNEKKIRNKGR